MNEEEIGIYFPDYYDHFSEEKPDWTIEVVCCECREAPEQGYYKATPYGCAETASIYID